MSAGASTSADSVERAPFDCRYLEPEAYLARGPRAQAATLAAIVHGQVDLPAAPWPQTHSQYQTCDASRPVVEVWSCDGAIGQTQDEGFALAWTEDVLFFSTAFLPAPGSAFESQVEAIYQVLFRLIERHGFPHPLRVWNILPDINADWDGLEQYRRFCRGRHEAFAAVRPDLQELYPAASALGARGQSFTLYGLAARLPGLTVENPKQISAFHYPPQYGPRSPSFSRALVKRWRSGATLFLSGTASITGHETRHRTRALAQTEQTLDNLRTLIAHAEERSDCAFPLEPATGLLKAFVRHREDYRGIRDLIESRLGSSLPVLYVDANICRSELLFEIEGMVHGTARPATP